MTNLIPTYALGDTPQTAQFGGLTLRENPQIGLAALALRRGSAQPAPFGLRLPGPGGFIEQNKFAAFWTGPDQWMVAGAKKAEEDFAAQLRAQAPACSITEQTDAWVGIDIRSDQPSDLHRVLEKTINTDLASFVPGSALRTGLEHLSVYVLYRSDTEISVLGMRSAAGSLWYALTRAAERNVPTKTT